MIPLGVVNQQTLGGGFTPADLSPEFWVEVGDIGDFYQDSSKTTAVTANGDPVGAWVDLSGNGNDLIQAIAANKPTYQTSSVDVDGIDDYLEYSSYVNPDEFIVGLRFDHATTESTRGVISIGPSVTSGTPFLIFQTTNTYTRVFIDGNYRFVLSNTLNSENSIVLKVTKPSTNYLVDVWLNGVKQTQYNAGTALSFAGLTHNVYLFTGYSGRTTNSIMGFILAEGSFSDTEAENLSDYLDGI